MSERLWVTWENHRRSEELSSEFCADYVPLIYDAKRPLRYFVLSMKTIFLLLKIRPKIVFCQNPSIVLTALLGFLKPIFRYKLIVDRHSNFKLEYKESMSLKWKTFHFLSNWTIRNSDLTIVTNDYLKKLCEESGGDAVVLQDKIPELFKKVDGNIPDFMSNLDKPQIMFVTMFDPDEPIKEIIEAASSLVDCICYLTGNYNKCYSDKDADKLSRCGVILTGFISNENYLSLMNNSDLVVVLTKKDFILNCGAYEAISLDKPLILSDTPTLRGYFKESAVYSECSASSIECRILEAAGNLELMKDKLVRSKVELKRDWSNKFFHVKSVVDSL